VVIDQNEYELIKQMPKIELHLHLEGAFTFDFLFNLIEKYGGDPEVGTIDELQKKFVFRDFQHFLDLWFWKNKFFKELDDFEKCAYTTLENLANQNVIYCEVFFSPWDFTSDRLSCEEITEATIHGIKRAEKDFSITCNLIADLVRDYDSTKAVERVKQILPYKDKGIIGIGLGGSEQKYPARLFKNAFKAARDLGFHVTAHAGEAAGPESVWEAIRELKVERIGHGVRAIEDEQLVRYLKDVQLPLEVCVNSNLKTKIFPSPMSHPIKRFINSGLNISINSDDPTMFGATITEEFMILYHEIGLSLDEIKQLILNSINSAFISEEMKKKINERANLFWSDKNW
jgi:adenosine deaminase